jgi:hypothetical protein
MEAKENTEMTAKAVSKAMAEKATSQMKRSKRVYGDYTPEKGVMTSKIVMDALENLKQATVRPKCAYGDLTTVQQRTQEYLLSCAAHHFVPTVEGWAIALGIGRKTLYKWLNNENLRCDKEFDEFLVMTHDAIMSVMSQSAFNRNVDTVWAIFYGKNYFGMSDKTEIVVTPPANPFGDTVTPEELQEKYLTDVSGYENTGEDE